MPEVAWSQIWTVEKRTEVIAWDIVLAQTPEQVVKKYAVM